MNALEEETQPKGGIVNYFQGATILNMVINGNMNKNGTDTYGTNNTHQRREATAEEVARSAKACTDMMWGPAATAVLFSACRDVYNWADNASRFERLMQKSGVDCPTGTISNAMRNNPYMKAHVDYWGTMGAPQRVMKLLTAFEKQVDGCVGKTT